MNVAACVRSLLTNHVCIEFQPSYGLLVRQIYARHNAAFDRSFNLTRFVIAASSIRSIEFNKLDGRFHV
jgi:hypothetical protein